MLDLYSVRSILARAIIDDPLVCSFLSKRLHIFLFHSRTIAISEDFRFALAVAAFAEVLRENPLAEKWSLALIADIAKQAMVGEANKERMAERQEFLSLIDKTRELKTPTRVKD